MTLEPLPLSLGDFLYAYSHAIQIKGRPSVQMTHGLQELRNLRGGAGVNTEWAWKLERALRKRAERADCKQAEPLPQFPNWAQTYPNYVRAWHGHRDGSDLLLIFNRLPIDHKLVVRAGCDCARTVLSFVPTEESLLRFAIETAEAWCDGQATAEQAMHAANNASKARSNTTGLCRHAYLAASNAAYAAYTAREAGSAATAIYAANAANAAAYAASAADADAAAYTAYAARVVAAVNHAARAVAYAADAYKEAQTHCADLVRSRIPWSAVRDALRAKEDRRLS